jgi:hypothetical protein
MRGGRPHRFTTTQKLRDTVRDAGRLDGDLQGGTTLTMLGRKQGVSIALLPSMLGT